ncbi:MAG: hypothetical protein M1570_02350 [Chloroflexi bacterium]|nr:hypothetical protein [Chloroflexota bacterium]
MPEPLTILGGLGSIATDFLKEKAKAKVQDLISKGPIQEGYRFYLRPLRFEVWPVEGDFGAVGQQ